MTAPTDEDYDRPRRYVEDDDADDRPRRRRRRRDEDDDYDDRRARRTESDVTGGLIPYKNTPALFSYYCGVFSLIPIFGVPLGLIAIVLGFMGLSKAKKQPEVRGKGHSITGIVLGFIGVGYHAAIVAAIGILAATAK